MADNNLSKTNGETAAPVDPKKAESSAGALWANLMKNEIANLSITLLILTAVFALLLSGVNAITAGPIAENKAAEQQAAMAIIFPDATGFEAVENFSGERYITSVTRVQKGTELLGYSIGAQPYGFKAEIEMIIGINSLGEVEGIVVTSMSETPGLGSIVQETDWLVQFAGKSSQITLVTGNVQLPSDVAAVSGATVSSRTVVSAVNEALRIFDTLS